MRAGVGQQSMAVKLIAPSGTPVGDMEPLTAHALRSFIRAYSTEPDQPIGIYLRAWSTVLLHGDEEAIRSLVPTLLAQLAVFHSPEDLWIALCVSDERRTEWEWPGGCRTACTGTRPTAPARSG
ncbi:hypothetical protein GCM10027075_39280 [Streptomyces heilongjiangensis]